MKNDIKEFIIDCMLFQSKDSFHKGLGLFVWVNVLQFAITLYRGLI